MKIPQKTISIAIPIAAVAVLVWTGLNLHFLDSSIIVPGLLALASIPFLYPLGLLFMGLPFLMTISILYGISPCVLATVPYAILGAAFLKNCSIHRKCFIFAFLVCNAFLYSLAYRLVDSSGSLVLGNIMFGVAAMVIVCFAFSFLARESERRKENVHLAYSFIIAGMCAAIAGSLASLSWWMPIAVLPLCGIVLGWNIINKERQQLLELLDKYQIPKPAAPQL